jgi:Flp pilus assembly protein TadD
MKASHAGRSCGAALLIGLALTGLAPVSASAGLFGRRSTPPAATAQVPPEYFAEIQRALDEQRLLDAGNLIDQALLAGDKNPRLVIFAGQLKLARARYDDALADFKQVETTPAVAGDALEGEGLALALLQRSDEAFQVLQKAVGAKPSAWRAWNALGSEYDARRRWPEAEAAYERALTESDRSPLVLNNRGFSRLLQGRPDDAVRDFVEALAKKPDLPAARTNLRLAMAMRGEYDRASAGAPQDNEAANLNNAGFVAMMRGDYAAAEKLFERAMQAKGEYYGRAAANAQLAQALKTQTEAAGPKAGDRAP